MIKKTIAILTMATVSVSSFAPLMVASSYIANADQASSTSTSSDTTTIGDGNSSSSTTSTSSSSASTNNNGGSWWNIPTPPTPPTPPTWPGWNNGTSTGTTTNPGGGTGTTTASTTASTTAKVTILKFIDGTLATASTSMNMNFDMTAIYNSTSTGSGTGTYPLGMNNATPYQAGTINFASGANYGTYENMNNVTGATCATSTNTGTTTASTTTATGTPFMLMGYTVGDTLSQAMSAVPSMTYPNFTNLMNNKYVIVWNHNCGNQSGTIGGNVTGGATSTASTSVGVLHVDSVETVSSNATADGTFANGFKYIFNITAPTNEQDLAMKFADWTNTANSGTIPVANNMRISSVQANSTSTIILTAANTYSGFLHIIGDLNPATVGNQIKVLVETMIPINTLNGSYTTSYGVKTQ